MNIKSNFLISIEENIEKSDISKYDNLTNNYYIILNNLKISLNYSNNAVFAKDKDENIAILLAGNIYQDDLYNNESIEQYLLEKYLLFNKDFVKHLNGSFCLFFANKKTDEVFFATDRFNTRNIFKYKKGKNYLFATDISNLPLRECKLSYAGVASFLINGAVFNNLTVFEEIKKLERSSLHKIGSSEIKSVKYWDYNFTNEYENKSESELSDELHNLYLQSLNKIISGKKNIFISLSGGYDSRGIAVMLKNIININHNVYCFSHNFGSKIENTDSDIAQQTAENLGFSFKLLNSYNGNLFDTFKNNAELGKGIASFCTEMDAWEQIYKDFAESEKSVLLTGDMYDGTYVAFHGNIKRALEKVHICEPSFLKEYKNYFSPETFNNLYENWENEYKGIIRKFSSYKNMVNLLDYLYMDQVIPNIYGNARECFQYPFIETATPYYDNDIINFIQKLPPNLRDRKKLHKKTLEAQYPEIFGIKFPSEGWGNEPIWIEEIESFSDVFIDNIKNNKSMLDDIISPEIIINSLLGLNNSENKIYKSKTVLKSFHQTVKRFIPSYHKIIENFPGGKELTRISGRYVNPRISHILIKILILRLFLSKM